MLSIVTNYLKDDNGFAKEHATVFHLWHFHIELFSDPGQMLCEMDIGTGGKHPSETSRVESLLLKPILRLLLTSWDVMFQTPPYILRCYVSNPPTSPYIGMLCQQDKPQSACHGSQIF